MEIFNLNKLEYNGKVFHTYFDTHDEPWWKAKDIADAVGFKDTDCAVRHHVFKEDQLRFKQLNDAKLFPGTHPNAIFINESGLYALIFGSQLRSAKEFKHWVTTEVLPSIRKHGEYKLKQEILDRDNTIDNLNKHIECLKFDRVDPAKDRRKQPQFILINKNSTSKFSYYVLRIQRGKREAKIKKVLAFCPEAEVVLSLDVSNSITLYNRLKESGLITHEGNHFYTSLSEIDIIKAIIDLKTEEQ